MTREVQLSSSLSSLYMDHVICSRVLCQSPWLEHKLHEGKGFGTVLFVAVSPVLPMTSSMYLWNALI